MRCNPVVAQVSDNLFNQVQQQAAALRAQGRPLLDFSIGDDYEPTHPDIPAALREAVPEVSRYPTAVGQPQLRQAIAGYIKRRYDLAVDPETEVIPTSGAKEAIFSTPLAFVDRSAADAVIWSVPGYPVYERGALYAGAQVWPVPTGDDFVFRAADVPDQAWEKARLLWLCSPSNPTGAVIPGEELLRFRQQAAAADVLLCADECYSDIYDQQEPTSILQVGGTKGVLAFLSLSKRSSMTGYRSGAIVGDPEAIAIVKKLRTGTGTASPEFTQAAAIVAWGQDEHAARVRDLIRRKRALMRERLFEMGIEVAASQAGLYLWVKVADGLQACDLLMEHGVVVNPGLAFGPGGENYIRLALVPTMEECEQALEVMEKCLTEN